MTAHQLLASVFPEPRWAVPGLLPEGGILLAGRPKGGKSWLMLQLALSISDNMSAFGKLPVEPGDVLYAALEHGPRRLQQRIRRMVGETGPPRLHLATTWPRQGDGCIEAIERWLDAHPAARLVALDTLARVRDRKVRGNSLYEADYDAIDAIDAFSDLANRRVSIVVIHHTRKPKENEEDPFDTISGTQGLQGAADMAAVLKKPVAGREGKLAITGRNIEERELVLCWDPEHCLWSLGDLIDGYSPEERTVAEMLRNASRALTPLEAAPLLRKSHDATKQLLRRMAEAGKIARSPGGRYSFLSPGLPFPAP